MSLNWSVAAVENSETVCFHHYVDEGGETRRQLSQSTHQLIFMTMVVGMGEITESNHIEFYKRVALFERLRGAVRVKQDDDGKFVDHPYALADIRQHIGLRTNVGLEKYNAWRKRIIENWERDLNIGLLD